MKRKLLALIAMSTFVASTAFADWTLDTVHEDSLAYNYPGSDLELVSHAPASAVGADESMTKKADSDNERNAATWPKIIVHEDSLAYNYPGSDNELVSHAGSDSIEVGDADSMMLKDDAMQDEKERTYLIDQVDKTFDNYR